MIAKLERRFLIIGALLITALLVVESINGRLWMNDLRVYYSAAKALLHGEAVYGNAFGLESGYFKYSPASLYFFIPFTYLQFEYFKLFYFLFIGFCGMLSILLALRLFGIRSYFQEKGAALLLVIALISAVHWHRELHLGNINLPVLLLVLLALDSVRDQKHWLGGLSIAIALLFKPHFVILIPLLFWFSRWKVGFAALGLFGIFNLVALVAYRNRGIELFSEWLVSMRSHNASLIYEGGDERQAINTIYTAVNNCLPGELTEGMQQTLPYLVLGISAILVLVYLLKQRSQKLDSTQLESGMWAIACAFVPSLTLTDTNHFLFTTPLICLLLSSWQRLNAIPRILIATGLFLYGANWADAWGQLSYMMRDLSFLGIGNLLLIALGLYAVAYRKPLQVKT